MRLILVLFLASCATSADDIARREIQAQYDRLSEAFSREDLETVLSFRTPDFQTIGPDGRHLNYAEMADYSRGWFELNEPPIDVRIMIQEIEMRGPDEAAVTVFQEGSRRQRVEGTLRTVRHSVIQRETWVRTPAGWKVRMVDQVRDQKRWVDGERVK
jgi:ketosteroid isomerase-like protein